MPASFLYALRAKHSTRRIKGLGGKLGTKINIVPGFLGAITSGVSYLLFRLLSN